MFNFVKKKKNDAKMILLSTYFFPVADKYGGWGVMGREGMGDEPQGPVVRKPINANPGLKVNQAFNFSCIKVFFSANIL